MSAFWFFVSCCIAATALLPTLWLAPKISGRRNRNAKRLLLIGLNNKAVRAAKYLARNRSARHTVIGYIDDREIPRIDTHGLTRLGSVEDAERIVEDLGIDEVWICYPMAGDKRTSQALKALAHSVVAVRFLLESDAFGALHCTTSKVSGLPVLDIHVAPLDHRINRIKKEVFDRTFALVALLLLSPLFVMIAIGVKLSSPGPVFYKQKRVGWKKEPFTMLKFRSMPVNAERSTGPVWARPGENRATRFGALLRQTSLDELPQFINVLFGEMSIVGPRPERPEFVDKFKHEVPWYMKKHMVKAGITGWAQVHGWRGETDLKERIEHDVYYIQHWSLLLDLKIILLTVTNGFVHPNAY